MNKIEDMGSRAKAHRKGEKVRTWCSGGRSKSDSQISEILVLQLVCWRSMRKWGDSRELIKSLSLV